MHEFNSSPRTEIDGCQMEEAKLSVLWVRPCWHFSDESKMFSFSPCFLLMFIGATYVCLHCYGKLEESMCERAIKIHHYSYNCHNILSKFALVWDIISPNVSSYLTYYLPHFFKLTEHFCFSSWSAHLSLFSIFLFLAFARRSCYGLLCLPLFFNVLTI